MTIGSPVIAGPISICSTKLVVKQVLANATVTVFQGGKPVGSTSMPRDANHCVIVTLSTTLVQGQAVTVRQVVGPDLAFAPQLIYPEYTPTNQPAHFRDKQIVRECTACVMVTGAYPGALLTILAANVVIGTGESLHGAAEVAISPVPIKSPLIVRQVLPCPIPNPPDGNLQYWPAPPVELQPPVLPTLFECQTTVDVTGIEPGAVATLFHKRGQGGFKPTSSCSSTGARRMLVNQLQEGDELTANQMWQPPCGGRFQQSPVSVISIVQKQPPAPTVFACAGCDQVVVESQIPNADISITRQKQGQPPTSIKCALTGYWGIFTIGSNLDDGEEVWASLELCSEDVLGPKVIAERSDAKLQFVTPLYESVTRIRLAASGTGLIPSVQIQRKRKGGSAWETISPIFAINKPSTEIDVQPLADGDTVSIKLGCCGEAGDDSVVQPVIGDLIEPVIERVLQCPNGRLIVSGFLPGTELQAFVTSVNNVTSPQKTFIATTRDIDGTYRAIIEAEMKPGDAVVVAARLASKDRQSKAAPVVNQPSDGEWEEVILPLDILAIHAALLPNQEVLLFGGDQFSPSTRFEQKDYKSLIWSPTKGLEGTVRFTANQAPHDVFCSGHCFLHDGRLLIVGGLGGYGTNYHDHSIGLRDCALFDAKNSSWSKTGSLNPTGYSQKQGQQAETGGRWYPAVVPLADKRCLAFAGHPVENDSNHVNDIAEAYDTVSETWSKDGNKGFAALLPTVDDPKKGTREDELGYPAIVMASNQQLLVVTTTFEPNGDATQWWVSRSSTTKSPGLLDPPSVDKDGRQHYLNEASGGLPPLFAFQQPCVLLPLDEAQDFRSVVMYLDQQHARLIDLGTLHNESNPIKWEKIPMNNPTRFHGMAVLLPDGTVFVHGGIGRINPNGACSDDDPTCAHPYPPLVDIDGVLQPEIFTPDPNNPLNGTFKTVAVSKIPRTYHSVSILLADGRVLVAGSSPNTRNSETTYVFDGTHFKEVTIKTDPTIDNRELRAELFSPPYLCKSNRIRLNAVGPISYGQTFIVDTPDAGITDRVVLMRHGSSTHAQNYDQRCIVLRPVGWNGNTLHVNAPPDTGVAPPGPYMVFLVGNKGNGTVSRAKTVMLDP